MQRISCVDRNKFALQNLWSIKIYFSGMNNKDPVVLFPIIEALFTTPLYAPQGIPKDIAFRLKRLHGHPGVWWVGQFIKYLFREQDWLENDLKKYQDEVGYDEPIVG